MSIMATYNIVVYVRCVLRVLLTIILQLFDIIFALSAMYVDWDPHLGLLVFRYYT